MTSGNGARETRPDVGPAGADRTRAVPSVSVVVASCRERELLEACLSSVLSQSRRLGAEVVVARPEDAGDLEPLRTSHPDVRFEPAPEGSNVPQLRAVGMAAARGDIVALTEDHCVAEEGWLRSLVEAHADGGEVVGGAMENARCASTVDWAAFFAEYGLFAGDGGGSGPEEDDEGAPSMTGANVSYARELVDRVVERAGRGEWENVIHDELAASGRAMEFLETAAVAHNRSWGVREFCVDRFLHGRDYARRRLDDAPIGRRWLWLVGTPVLPMLLCARIARAAAGRHPGIFLRALPATLLFLAAWSAGEAAGYLLGPAHGPPADATPPPGPCADETSDSGSPSGGAAQDDPGASGGA